MNLIVAVDFTSSNGDPVRPDSLHFRSPNALNPYQLAIRSVGDILLEYDTDKRVPVYGFGAKFRDGSVSHCFSLNGQQNNPEVYGVEGILEIYNYALSNITLWGPTNFTPVSLLFPYFFSFFFFFFFLFCKKTLTSLLTDFEDH